jgi:hypothetical protein
MRNSIFLVVCSLTIPTSSLASVRYAITDTGTYTNAANQTVGFTYHSPHPYIIQIFLLTLHPPYPYNLPSSLCCDVLGMALNQARSLTSE